MGDAYDSDDIWTVFAESSITLHHDGRERLVGRDRLPWEGPVFVLTAWNPGRTRPLADNIEANRRLERLIEDRGFSWCTAVGASPDGSWSEDGFAVSGPDREEAVALGARFGQMAIYELDRDRVLIVTCPEGRVIDVTDRRAGQG
ncbi:MAG: DUF3293 domain-containing protein [Microthrixaceae bacterium]